MITGKELIEKLYSDAPLVEGDEKEEKRGIKNYENGSIHLIYDGRRPYNNDFKVSLGEELLNALDKFFEECADKPLDIDIIINVREK